VGGTTVDAALDCIGLHRERFPIFGCRCDWLYRQTVVFLSTILLYGDPHQATLHLLNWTVPVYADLAVFSTTCYFTVETLRRRLAMRVQILQVNLK
jgi:hypothetical protein